MAARLNPHILLNNVGGTCSVQTICIGWQAWCFTVSPWHIDSDPPRFTSLFYLMDLLSFKKSHLTEQQGEETRYGGL